MSTSDDDRIAYLSGEPVDSLTPQERAELDELRTLLETPATWEEPDAALEDRIVSAIADEARRARPVESDAPGAGPRRRRARRRGFRWPFRRPALVLGGLATAAAAIVVAIVLAVASSSPAPLRFAMVVSGTSLAPGAHGSATLTKMSSGWEIQLSATGLPHLADGHYYQAWLKNAAGILVPVGTFNDAEHVILWSGAPVTQFRSFSVTVQLANGNPVSSGRRVLVGVAHPCTDAGPHVERGKPRSRRRHPPHKQGDHAYVPEGAGRGVAAKCRAGGVRLRPPAARTNHREPFAAFPVTGPRTKPRTEGDRWGVNGGNPGERESRSRRRWSRSRPPARRRRFRRCRRAAR